MAVIFGSFTTYALYQADQKDPDLVKKVQTVLSERFDLKNLHIRINGAGAYTDFGRTKSSSHFFSAQIKQIEVSSVSADIEVRLTDADDVIVETQGELAATAPSQRLIEAKLQNETLTIEERDDGSTKNVKINIYIPKSYSKEFSIDTVSGNVLIENLQFEELNVNTVSGEINIGQDSSQDIELNSVSGNIKLNVKKPELLKIDVETISGKIVNNYKTSNQGTISAELHTVSGDIALE